MPRRYNQFCALARALDVVGERWTLLIVRELLLGPKRFTDLLAALPGIGRNLLAARLRELEEAGVLEPAPADVRGPGPAGAAPAPADGAGPAPGPAGGAGPAPGPADGPAPRRGYRLTARGRGLEEPLLALTRWEMEAMTPPHPGDERRPGWYALAMWAAFRPEAARDESYEFRVAGEPFHLEVRAGRPSARHGHAPDPACVLETDLDTFLLMATGLKPVDDALGDGSATATGSRPALNRCLRAFALPAPRTSAEAVT